ncbi:Uncharacterised protein [Vibrio cholerae]|nr:Uncharacterised protein [Vibrio cholerae]
MILKIKSPASLAQRIFVLPAPTNGVQLMVQKLR